MSLFCFYSSVCGFLEIKLKYHHELRTGIYVFCVSSAVCSHIIPDCHCYRSHIGILLASVWLLCIFYRPEQLHLVTGVSQILTLSLTLSLVLLHYVQPQTREPHPAERK